MSLTKNGPFIPEFEEDEEDFRRQLAEQIDRYGWESCTEDEQAFMEGAITYERYNKLQGV